MNRRHNFLAGQPDLNWWEPAVHREFRDILDFWFERGVAGTTRPWTWTPAPTGTGPGRRCRNRPYSPGEDLLRIVGVQNFLESRQHRTDGGTEDYSSQKCVVIVFRLISVVDAIRDSGGYLTAGYRFVPGRERCAGEFHWEY